MAVQGFKFSDGTVVKYDYPALDNITTDKTLSIENAAADGKAVGNELTIIKEDLGDLDDLATSDKTSLVNAINEAAQTGGGGAGRDIEIYVEGSALVINSQLVDGNEVSY